MKARRARPQDVAAVHGLIARYAAEDLLLPRSEHDVRANIGRFLVLTEEDQLLGCVALEPYSADLAEIRSLAVNPQIRGRGLGVRLVRFALAVARRRRIARVFAVTHAPKFFIRQGFVASTRQTLPEKIERDCCTCPKASHCELVAVIATVCPERLMLPVYGESSSRASLPTSAKPVPAL